MSAPARPVPSHSVPAFAAVDPADPFGDPLLFAGAATARRHLHPAVAVLITVVVTLVPAVLLTLPGPAAGEDVGGLGGALHEALRLVLPFGVIIALLWLWVRFREGRGLGSLGLTAGGVARGAARRFGLGLAVGVGLYAVVVLPLWATGVLTRESGTHTGLAVLPGVLVLGVAFAVQSLSEELVFRGYLLPVVGVRAGARTGLVVSIVVFTVLHLLGNPPRVMYYLDLVLAATLAGVWALRAGSLWPVWGWHLGANWSLGNLWGLQGDEPMPGGSLVDLHAASADGLRGWLAGGAAGLEGSPLVTLAYVITIAVLLRPRRDRG